MYSNGHTPKDFAMDGFLETAEGILSILLEDWSPILELFNNFYVMLISNYFMNWKTGHGADPV